MSVAWWNHVIVATVEELVAMAVEDPKIYDFVTHQYENMLLAYELNKYPKEDSSVINERVTQRASEVREACRRAMEAITRNLHTRDHALDLLKQFNNGEAEKILRDSKRMAEMVCESPCKFVDHGERAHLLMYALLESPWHLFEKKEYTVGAVNAMMGHNELIYGQQISKICEKMAPETALNLSSSVLASLLANYSSYIPTISDAHFFMRLYERMMIIQCDGSVMRRASPDLTKNEDFLFHLLNVNPKALTTSPSAPSMKRCLSTFPSLIDRIVARGETHRAYYDCMYFSMSLEPIRMCEQYPDAVKDTIRLNPESVCGLVEVLRVRLHRPSRVIPRRRVYDRQKGDPRWRMIMESPSLHGETTQYIPEEYLGDMEFTKGALRMLEVLDVDLTDGWAEAVCTMLYYAFLPGSTMGLDQYRIVCREKEMIRTNIYSEMYRLIVKVLPFMIRKSLEKDSYVSCIYHGKKMITQVLGAFIACIPDKASLLALVYEVPSVLLVCDTELTRLGCRGWEDKWYIDEEILQVALKKEPELYTQIPRGYRRESVLRWGVRHSLDMRAAYNAWTGEPCSRPFRDFHLFQHYSFFSEIFGDLLKRALPFVEHLVVHIMGYLACHNFEEVRLPRNLPVRAFVDGQWLPGTVRKMKHPLYGIRIPQHVRATKKRKKIVDVMDCDLRYTMEDLKRCDPVQPPVFVHF